jgi:hypothetical protein
MLTDKTLLKDCSHLLKLKKENILACIVVQKVDKKAGKVKIPFLATNYGVYIYSWRLKIRNPEREIHI